LKNIAKRRRTINRERAEKKPRRWKEKNTKCWGRKRNVL